MGNQQSYNVPAPNTSKKTKDFVCESFSFGQCEMQGWRPYMEDVSLSHIEGTNAVFGVFDGHGGYKVAKFVAKYFHKVLSNLNDFKHHRYEQALLNTFIKFDELLRIDLVNNILKNMLDSSDDEESQLGFLKFSIVNIKDNSSCVNPNLDLSALSDSNKKIRKKNLSTNLLFKPLLTIKSCKIKDDPYSENEEILKSNRYSLKESSGEQLIYSFGGVVIEESNQKITESLVSFYSGTTANIILLIRNHLYIANAGDSLAVMYKNRKAIKLNTEHKLNIISERDRVTKAGKKIFNNRIEGKLNVSRAIGDFCFKNNDNLKLYEQPVISYPEVKKYHITSDTEFIVMGSDGFWDCVDVQQICQYISIQLKEKSSPISKIISGIFDRILSKTERSSIGTDNMSCIIIKFNE